MKLRDKYPQTGQKKTGIRPDNTWLRFENQVFVLLIMELVIEISLLADYIFYRLSPGVILHHN